MRLQKLILLAGVAAVLSSCSSIQLDQGAQKIIATPNPAPKGCKYVGQVAGNQGNFFTGTYTSNKNLEIGAMNDLKNQAAKLGANYVQLVTTRAGNTGSISSYDGGFSGSMSQTNVTNMGNAYICPQKVL